MKTTANLKPKMVAPKQLQNWLSGALKNQIWRNPRISSNIVLVQTRQMEEKLISKEHNYSFNTTRQMKTISEMGNVVYMVRGKNQAVPLSFLEMPAKYFPWWKAKSNSSLEGCLDPKMKSWKADSDICKAISRNY